MSSAAVARRRVSGLDEAVTSLQLERLSMSRISCGERGMAGSAHRVDEATHDNDSTIDMLATPAGAGSHWHVRDSSEGLAVSTSSDESPFTAQGSALERQSTASPPSTTSSAPSLGELYVQVLLDGIPGGRFAIPAMSSETVRELKLRLSAQSWFRKGQCLMFGDRELQDQQPVADIMQRIQDSGNSNYLHVFVRAQNVESGRVKTHTNKSISFGDLSTVEEATSPTHCADDADDGPSCTDRQLSTSSSFSSLPLLGSVPDLTEAETAALAPTAASGSGRTLLAAQPPASDSPGVIHLVIRKSARVKVRLSKNGRFEITVNVHSTSAEVTKALLPASEGSTTPRLFGALDLYHNGVKLQANKPLIEYGLENGAILDLVPWEPTALRLPPPKLLKQAREGTPVPIAMPSWGAPQDELPHTLQAWMGIKAGVFPESVELGTGGVYKMRATRGGAVVAIFKPQDEEACMPNNPKGFAPIPSSSSTSSSSPSATTDSPLCGSGGSLRRGIQPGEGMVREVAAYLLDHEHRASVPATTPCMLLFPDSSVKVGSLQEFVQHEMDCEEMGNSAFSVEQVHKIAVLDLRLANADRNGGNILACREADGEWTLVPIDHGCCLPDTWEDMSFEWSHWRQARVCFSPDTAEYIDSLDPEKDLSMLRERGIHLRPECARIFKAACLVLKKVAARKLAPADAADILERGFSGKKSIMEKMHKRACELGARDEQRPSTRALIPYQGSSLPPASASRVPYSDALYLRHLSDLLDEYLDSTFPVD